MTLEELRSLLKEQGASFEEKPIQNGTQVRCTGGEVFSVYETGSVVCGGKITDLTSRVKSRLPPGGAAGPVAAQPAAKDAIFIVYGHDTQARDELELLLHKLGLHPVIFADLPGKGETIIEKLESYFGRGGKAAYACVLLTPDDEGRKVGEANLRYRARQNVVLELGMVLAQLGRKRVAILRKKTVEQPSDIDGLLYIPFEERLEEIKVRIFQELEAAGFQPRL